MAYIYEKPEIIAYTSPKMRPERDHFKGNIVIQPSFVQRMCYDSGE